MNMVSRNLLVVCYAAIFITSPLSGAELVVRMFSLPRSGLGLRENVPVTVDLRILPETSVDSEGIPFEVPGATAVVRNGVYQITVPDNDLGPSGSRALQIDFSVPNENRQNERTNRLSGVILSRGRILEIDVVVPDPPKPSFGTPSTPDRCGLKMEVKYSCGSSPTLPQINYSSPPRHHRRRR